MDAKATDDWKYKRRRNALVELLREKGISNDNVLEAIGRVRRHLFVDDALISRAYLDEALPIGLQQTISQPFTVAYQTGLLGISSGDKVLEVGTGSGYQAAVLCELGAKVYSIERIRPLYERTRRLLHDLEYRVITHYGDGSVGWPAFAPYDAIVVTAGAREVPKSLLEQLRLPAGVRRGGRLIIPVGSQEDGQVMNRFERMGNDEYEQEEMDGFRFVPLLSGDA